MSSAKAGISSDDMTSMDEPLWQSRPVAVTVNLTKSGYLHPFSEPGNTYEATIIYELFPF